MANYYVSSVSGDGTTGASWATAELTIQAGMTAATANGDIVYVDSAHTESLSTDAAWDVPTSGTSIAIISVDRNGSTTTGHNGWLAGAVSTMGTSGFGHQIGNGAVTQGLYFFGIRMNIHSTSASANAINVGSNTSSSGFATITMRDCTFSGGVTNGGAVTLGASGASAAGSKLITLINPVFNARSSNNTLLALQGGKILISGMTVSFSGATKPDILISAAGGQIGQIEIVDSDLSGYNESGGFYFNQGMRGTVVMRNCKISSTPGLLSSTAYIMPTTSFTFINVDSGDTKHTFEYRNAFGTLTESTSVYANSGAVVGGVNHSWQIVTTSLCGEATPFTVPYLHRYSSSTSSITAGFRVVRDSATDLNDRNLWSEIEYVSSSTFPLGTLVSNRNAQPFDGTAADWTNDSESWTGISGFTNQNTQTLSSTFTPGEGSLIRGRLNVGVASTTLYLDPLLRIA